MHGIAPITHFSSLRFLFYCEIVAFGFAWIIECFFFALNFACASFSFALLLFNSNNLFSIRSFCVSLVRRAHMGQELDMCVMSYFINEWELPHSAVKYIYIYILLLQMSILLSQIVIINNQLLIPHCRFRYKYQTQHNTRTVADWAVPGATIWYINKIVLILYCIRWRWMCGRIGINFNLLDIFAFISFISFERFNRISLQRARAHTMPIHVVFFSLFYFGLNNWKIIATDLMRMASFLVASRL